MRLISCCMVFHLTCWWFFPMRNSVLWGTRKHNLGCSIESVSSIFWGDVCRTKTFPFLVPPSAWLGNAVCDTQCGLETCPVLLWLFLWADDLMIEHPSVLDRFGVEPVDWCKKINQSVRRREEESQYLSGGFAHEDGVDGLQLCSSHFSRAKASCGGSHQASRSIWALNWGFHVVCPSFWHREPWVETFYGWIVCSRQSS